MPVEVHQLTDEQLADVLRLAKASDSVELKLSISAGEQRAALAALRVDPLDAQIRQVFYFDTPDLALFQSGLVVRARRIQGRGGDTAVKLRPVEPSALPEEIRQAPTVKVEVDAMPGGYVCSATVKGVGDAAAIRKTAAGNGRISKLFTKQQRRFYVDHAPEGLGLDDLSVLGPTFALKTKLAPKALGRRLVVEFWLYPDGSRILELSTVCMPGEGLNTAVELRLYLEGLGIDVYGEQQTKTKTALEFFSSELAAPAAKARAEEAEPAGEEAAPERRTQKRSTPAASSAT